MSRRGRPLRFLCGLSVGWIGLRLALLWPSELSLPALLHVVVPGADAQIAAAPPSPLRARLVTALPAPTYGVASPHAPASHDQEAFSPVLALAALMHYGNPVVTSSDPPAASVREVVAVPPIAPAPGAPGKRWSVSGWVVARGDGGTGVDTAQLGGAQAGIRLAYLLDRAHRFALAARFSSPLRSSGKEIAVGVDWQPTRLPVRLLVEQRFGLDHQGSGPAALLVGGIGPAAIGGGFTLEGYGEAGAVQRHRTEPFADGALRIAHPIAAIGRAGFDLGAGLWGARQRGAGRLDVGPSLGVHLPSAVGNLRLGVDWRQRIAGRAHPGSGPVITLGGDF